MKHSLSNMNTRIRFIRLYFVIAMVSFCSVATSAEAQSWNYLTTTTSMTGSRVPGYVTLETQGNKSIFRMSAGNLNRCYQGDLSAVVSRTEAETIITIEPKLTGCEEIRFVIKNDGSGGRREVKNASDWVWDGAERGLTLRK